MQNKVSIILSTYNEASVIEDTINKISDGISDWTSNDCEWKDDLVFFGEQLNRYQK